MDIDLITQRFEDDQQILTGMINAIPPMAVAIKDSFLTTRMARVNEIKHQGRKAKYCPLFPRVRLNKGSMEIFWRRAAGRKKATATQSGITTWKKVSPSEMRKYTTDIDVDLIASAQEEFKRLKATRSALIKLRTTVRNAGKAVSKLGRFADPMDQEQFPIGPSPNQPSAQPQTPGIDVKVRSKRTGALVSAKKLPALKQND